MRAISGFTSLMPLGMARVRSGFIRDALLDCEREQRGREDFRPALRLSHRGAQGGDALLRLSRNPDQALAHLPQSLCRVVILASRRRRYQGVVEVVATGSTLNLRGAREINQRLSALLRRAGKP